MGTPAAIARRNGPFLNGPTDLVSCRVPSGAMTTERPFLVSSSASFNDSTAFFGSSRSMKMASISLPRVPTTGSFLSSFLPTPVQLSLTIEATSTGSMLFR